MSYSIYRIADKTLHILPVRIRKRKQNAACGWMICQQHIEYKSLSLKDVQTAKEPFLNDFKKLYTMTNVSYKIY